MSDHVEALFTLEEFLANRIGLDCDHKSIRPLFNPLYELLFLELMLAA